MAFSFQTFFFDKLPLYFLQNDTYKDQNGRGLLERYLEIFGLELENKIKPLADDYLDIIDPSTVTAKHLSHLAYSLGNPPDMFQNNPTQYAKLLQHVVSIYKIKGTAQSYKLFFSLMGFNVSIIEHPEPVPTLFDDVFILDDGFKFDMGCPTCSDYSLVINNLLANSANICMTPSFTTLNQTMLDLIIEVVKFLEPINAHLIEIINGGLVCEAVSHCYQEDINLYIIDPTALDDGDTFDNSEILDSSSVLSTTTISHLTCTINLPVPPTQYASFDDSFKNATEFE